MNMDSVVVDSENTSEPQDTPIAKPFRFKSTRRKSPSTQDDNHNDSSNDRKRRHRESTYRSNSLESSSRSSRKHRRRHHHRHRHDHHHHRSHAETSTPSTPRNLDSGSFSPTTAFRESLFDALADDEGAMFWEGVYGQPLHTYGPPPSTHSPQDPADEIHSMTDEDYVAYVRARMWEKTHEGVAAEREARANAARRNAEATKAEKERSRFAKEVDDSLRRGQERRARKEEENMWRVYGERWRALNDSSAATSGQHRPGEKDDASRISRHDQEFSQPHSQLGAEHTSPSTSNPVSNTTSSSNSASAVIPWPTPTLTQKALTSTTISNFLHLGATLTRSQTPTNSEPTTSSKTHHNQALKSILKLERVKWHPDKMQQRLGASRMMDDRTRKAVTSVFQVVNGMWADLKGDGERERRNEN